MKNKLKTLTIGVCAHNEEHSIEKLLKSILAQRKDGFKLSKIIVVSDGSSDNTADVVKKYQKKYNVITLVDDGKRVGKAMRLNEMYRNNTSDIILILDADVRLGKNVLTEITSQFDSKKVGLVGGFNVPEKPRNYFEKAIVTWITIWNEIRVNINGGVSVHNNLGCVSALSKNFAKIVHIPNNIIPDDDFTYFTAIKAGFHFKFAKKAIVYYRTVNNLSDFFTQHSRLIYSKQHVAKHFGDWVNNYYGVSKKEKYKTIFANAIKHPILVPFALFLQILLRFKHIVPQETYENGYWKTAVSTKALTETKHKNKNILVL